MCLPAKRCKRPRKELEVDIRSLSDDFGGDAKKLKPSTSYDSDFWTKMPTSGEYFASAASANSAADMEPPLHFLNYNEPNRDNVSGDDLHTIEQAQNLDCQILAHRQVEDIAGKQAPRLQQS